MGGWGIGWLLDTLGRLEVRLNRPFLPSGPDTLFWSLYQTEGQTLDRAPDSLVSAAAGKIDLMIALTTYNRPDAFRAMLDGLAAALANAGRPLNWHILVLQDGNSGDYGPMVARARRRFGDRITWLTARERLGKQGYWKAYQTLFLAARILGPAHALFLQDDLEFPDTLIQESYRRWEALEGDARRRVLYLFASADDEPEGRWIRFRREQASNGARLTRWFDLQGLMVDRRFFEVLHYRMIPVSRRRWEKKPYSSGVGEQLTRRLFHRGNVYQAHPSLVFHGAHPSEMNPEARAERLLDNRPPSSASG